MAPKKDKKKKKEEPPEQEVRDEVLVATTDLEEPEEVQYTDTSYTSASFESLPPVPVEEPVKKKKTKKKHEQVVEVVQKVSDEFEWSAESLPVIEEQQHVEEEEKKPPKKKGPKGKKPKKEVEEIPNFEKPKNWKSMQKKERDAWMAKRIEEWHAEKEAEKQAILAGAKEKKLRLERERQELMAQDNAEQEIRRDILDKTCILFHRYEKEKFEYIKKKQKEYEWRQYLKCDGLPDPQVTTQMNTYLHVWRELTVIDAKELEKRCIETLPMLEVLDELTANCRAFTPLQAEGYFEVRSALRTQLAETIQCASYTLLRNIEKNLKMESIKLATYAKEFKGLRLNLWVAIRMPTRKPKEVEDEPDPVELEFPAMRTTIRLPKIIDGRCVCVRAARSMIDLLSEASRTFALKMDIANRFEDLFEFNIKEHLDVIKLKKEYDGIRSKFYKEIRQRTKEIEAFLKANVYAKNDKEKDELDELNIKEPPPLPDPRTHIAEMNEHAFQKFLKLCTTRTRNGEVNLRKYRISGGVLNLDLLTTPPQPKRLRGEVYLTTLQLPKKLVPVKYQVQYRAPSPPAPGVVRTPEEIEAEIKKTEAIYEKLALVFIELPRDVIWSEPPVVCQWQESRKLWTINYINDYKFNEDKLTIQFRTGVLWPIGIATLRYSNMPYQGWELKPDPKGRGVIITVTGVCLTVTWLCRGNKVRLMFIANATTPALREHYNKPYSVKRMVSIMREAACDFFPEFDGHNHVEGSCPKEWVMERHTYHAMAFLSKAYNFQWSRWNAQAGSRNIVMQLREAVDKKREGKLQLLYVTPQRCLVLKSNELMQEFNTEPMMGMEFYPDLFTLNLSYGSIDARRATFKMKYKLVETVFDMLSELKLCSFS